MMLKGIKFQVLVVTDILVLQKTYQGLNKYIEDKFQ